MTRTLLRKELCQHWLALLLLCFLMFAGYGLILAGRLISGEAGSVFESLRMFIMVIVVLGGLVLCHRLVVMEYAARTQLFLEALPVARWRMVAVKYVIGLGLMLGIVGIALAASCAIGHRNEILTPRFITILAARALSATLFAYNFFFLMGFLGRYRLALYLTALLACFAVAQLTDLELDRFGPFALLDERFPYENDRVPWDALRTTWTLSALFLLLAVTFSLTREGTVATLLAEKMSHREKVFIAALLVGVTFALSVLDEKTKRAPFELHNAVTENRPGIVINVASQMSGEDTDAKRLAQHIADKLSSSRIYLGLAELPPVFITRRRDLDANRYERGQLEEASGLHVQANFGASEFDRDNFAAWLLREALIVQSDGRVKYEPKMWVLDGFAPFYFAQEQAAAPPAQNRTLALRALYGIEMGFTPSDLRRWHSFRERVGEDIAGGVAWSGLRTIARRQGPESCQRFIRSVLGVSVPKDFRALQHERSASLDRLLLMEAGVEFNTLWAQWLEELAAARNLLASELVRIPKLTGEVSFAPLSAASRKISYHVRIEPARGDTRYSFLYHQLPAFDEEVAPQSIRREQNLYAQRPNGELPQSFTRGARLYWTFSLEVPELRCPVISGWKREEIR